MVSVLNVTNNTITDACHFAAWTQSKFDPSDDIIYCQQFDANDYYQVFTVGFIMCLIYLGMYLLSYRHYISYTMTIKNARMSSLTSTQGYQQLTNKINEDQKRELTLDRYAGIPFKLYLFLNSLLCLTYLSIKIILLTNVYDFVADNAYKDINAQFNAGFKEFVNAQTIILTFLMIHNISNVKSITYLYNLQKASLFNTSSRCLLLLCLLIIWIDFIASMVIICYKWSLLIFTLYWIAVSLIFVVCLIISCCFIYPVIICFVLLVMKVFTICGTNNCFGRFIMSLGSAFIVAILAYLSLCIILCFLFLFVNGPQIDQVIFLNKNDPNHMAVAILFCCATFIGFLAMFIGALYDCKYKLYDDVEAAQQLTSTTNRV